MKTVIATLRTLAGAFVAIALPVIIWNTIGLDFVDTKGKLLPFVLTPIFAISGTAIILGTKDAHKPPFIKNYVNGWYGFVIGFLVINILIVVLSNT